MNVMSENHLVAGRAEPLLVVENLIKHYLIKSVSGIGYEAVRSVDGISLSVERGEVLGIVGESGSGKSTLARAILRLVSVNSGRVLFEGRSLSELRGARLKELRRSMQLIFQDPLAALDPRMSIETSLTAPLAQHGIGTRTERRRMAEAMLEEVGLDASFLPRRPSQCSGGQLQRVVIARALLLKPRILICDEPTSALDASIRAQILNLLIDLKERFGLTLIMISHDLRVVRYMCDRVAVMYLGKIIETAPTDVIFDRPAHPYTRALMAASMLLGTASGDQSAQVEGEPPSPIRLPQGCRFHPRCFHAQARCREHEPSADIAPAHSVACHFPLLNPVS